MNCRRKSQLSIPMRQEAHLYARLLADRKLFDRAKEEFSCLKRASRTLAKLQSSLSRKLASTEKAVAPSVLHHGIHSIPDELLAKIFLLLCETPNRDNEYALSGTALEGNEKLRRLALVDRRFCDIIFSSQTIWADVGYELDWSRRRTVGALARMGDTGFHIKLLSQSDLNVSGTEKCVGRWRSLRARLPTLIHHLDVAAHKQYTTLRCLSIHHFEVAAEDEDLLSTFLDTRFLPALEELDLRFIDPLNPIFPDKLIPRLTSLSLRGYICRTPQELRKLFTCLATGVQLRWLTIYLDIRGPRSMRLNEHDLWELTEQQPIHLPKLEEFRLHIARVGDTHVHVLRTLMMPQLKSLSLELGEWMSPNYGFEFMFPTGRDFNLVRHLELRFDYDEWEEIYPTIFRTFHRIDSLLLCLSGSDRKLHGVSKLVRLRRLEFRASVPDHDDFDGGYEDRRMEGFVRQVVEYVREAVQNTSSDSQRYEVNIDNTGRKRCIEFLWPDGQTFLN